MQRVNPQLCILGLTATPYRVDTGWIYRFNHRGYLRTDEPRFFERCIFELTLQQMIDGGYLTPPVQIDAPVASYDFSSLELPPGSSTFNFDEVEAILKNQARITPVIVQNIIELAASRKGAILFTSSVQHAKTVLQLLPPNNAALVVGDTPGPERDAIIERFKARQIKFLVNVSVLTTGFDAPHVDLIAILRPTESVSLYQQIVGRGLRLYEGKTDCLILDYTGVPHDLFTPQITDRRPSPDAVPVEVPCPKCRHINDFWGLKDADDEVVEHFGHKCKGASLDPKTGEIVPCGFRYRFRICDCCGAENDTAARICTSCCSTMIDESAKLRDAMGMTDAHVMQPDSMVFEIKVDNKGVERLEIRYYDLDGQHLSEVFFFDSPSGPKVFFHNFIRMHNRLPERTVRVQNADEAVQQQRRFRKPLFVIARKQGRFWKIREKVFV